MRIQYGNIDTVLDWQWPTLEIFQEWLCDFISLPETKYFDIYLIGGFLEKMNGKKEHTPDVDIILTKNNDVNLIEKLIFEGTRLGLEKYGVFFDILWFDSLPIYKFIPKGETKKTEAYILSNKWIVDGEIKKIYTSAKQIGKNIWSMEMTFPNNKQLALINQGYVYSDPLLINKGI